MAVTEAYYGMHSTQDTSLPKDGTFQQKRSIFHVRLSGGHGGGSGSRRGVLLLLFLGGLNRGNGSNGSSRSSRSSSRCLDDRSGWRSRSSDRRRLGLGRLGSGSFGGRSGVGLGGFSSGSYQQLGLYHRNFLLLSRTRSGLRNLSRLGDRCGLYRLHLSLGFGGLLSRGGNFSCRRRGSWLSCIRISVSKQV